MLLSGPVRDVSGPETRIRFVTEGRTKPPVLSDPLLKQVGVVILDEFHERHLEGDFCARFGYGVCRRASGPICGLIRCQPR